MSSWPVATSNAAIMPTFSSCSGLGMVIPTAKTRLSGRRRGRCWSPGRKMPVQQDLGGDGRAVTQLQVFEYQARDAQDHLHLFHVGQDKAHSPCLTRSPTLILRLSIMAAVGPFKAVSSRARPGRGQLVNSVIIMPRMKPNKLPFFGEFGPSPL